MSGFKYKELYSGHDHRLCHYCRGILRTFESPEGHAHAAHPIETGRGDIFMVNDVWYVKAAALLRAPEA